MASRRAIFQLLRRRFLSQSADQEGFGSSSSNPFLRALALLGAGVSGLLGLTSIATATDEALEGLAPPSYPWPHKGILSSYDHSSGGGKGYGRWLMDLMMKVRCILTLVTRDRFPQPYPNELAARYANGGAYPPDLSLITKARHNGQNYAFALLTGYLDPPAGVEDVTTFLSWAAEPEMEERKMMGFKWIFLLSLALFQAVYYKRLKWSNLKSRN